MFIEDLIILRHSQSSKQEDNEILNQRQTTKKTSTSLSVKALVKIVLTVSDKMTIFKSL